MSILKKNKAILKIIHDINNSIILNCNEITENLKEERQRSYLEFYQEVKKNRNYAFRYIESEKFSSKITEKEYERLRQIIHNAILDVENETISKELFFNICSSYSKKNKRD